MRWVRCFVIVATLLAALGNKVFGDDPADSEREIAGRTSSGETAKPSPRELEETALKRQQEQFRRILTLIELSLKDHKLTEELDRAATEGANSYDLRLSLWEIRHYGHLVKLLHLDAESCKKAKGSAWVIDGVDYGQRCKICNGHGKCVYCKGTGMCISCKGTGRVEFTDGSRPCKFCNGGRCPRCKGDPGSNKCVDCDGAGALCKRDKLKRNLLYLHKKLSHTSITKSMQHHYLGMLYMEGRGGLPKDRIKAGELWDRALDAGFIQEEIVRAKKALTWDDALDILNGAIAKYPLAEQTAEAERLKKAFTKRLIAAEIVRAKKAIYPEKSVDILEKVMEKYPGENLADVRKALQMYRRELQMRERQRSGGGMTTTFGFVGGGIFGGGGVNLRGATSTGFTPVGGIRGPRR